MITLPLYGFMKTGIVIGFWDVPNPRLDDETTCTNAEYGRERRSLYRGFFDSQVKESGLVPMKTAERSCVGHQLGGSFC